MLVVLSGVDPVDITEYAVVFSVVALPLTCLPVLLIPRDRTYMGEHVNGPFASVVGWLYFGVILVLALAATPLLIATNAGAG